jgi:hypothetical protein
MDTQIDFMYDNLTFDARPAFFLGKCSKDERYPNRDSLTKISKGKRTQPAESATDDLRIQER